ncbi:MAG: DMT family transporter [Lachnospira sp.]
MNTKKNFLSRPAVVLFGALICCALWGSAFPCIKIGYKMMHIASSDTASQILYAGCRFTLAGILAVFLGSLTQRQFLLPTKASLPHILELSLLQTILQYLFFYIGLAHTTGVKASIIEAVSTFVAIFVAGFLFHQEKVTARKMLGCLVGFAGVVLVNVAGNGMDLHFTVNGDGAILLSTVAYAFSSVFMKRFSVQDNPVMLSGYQFILGGIVMAVCGFFMGGHLSEFTLPAFAMLFYLGVISAVAYSLWGLLLKYNPISKVAVFGFMNPVIGVLLSAVLLGEKDSLGFSSIAALLLVCTGIYIVNKAPKETA